MDDLSTTISKRDAMQLCLTLNDEGEALVLFVKAYVTRDIDLLNALVMECEARGWAEAQGATDMLTLGDRTWLPD